MPPSAGAIQTRLDGEDHPWFERRGRARDEKRRLVDRHPDGVASPVQALAEIGPSLQDRPLYAIDLARRRAGPTGGDRGGLSLAYERPHLLRPGGRRPGGGAAGEVTPVAVQTRRDVGHDDIAGAQRPPGRMRVGIGGVLAEEDDRMGSGRATLPEEALDAPIELSLQRSPAAARRRRS